MEKTPSPPKVEFTIDHEPVVGQSSVRPDNLFPFCIPRIAIWVLVLLAVMNVKPTAQCAFDEAAPFDGGQSDAFGGNVSLDLGAGVLVAGSRFWDGPAGVNQGSAYVYEISGRNLFFECQITAPDAETGASFASAVIIEGQTMFLAAPLHDSLGVLNAGAVYVYTNQEGVWTNTQIVLPSDPAANKFFGSGMSLDGDSLMISASGDSTVATSAGAVYEFKNVNGSWVEGQKVVASDGSASAFFSLSRHESGLLLVGVSGDDDLGNGAGAAYVFEFDGTVWVEIQKIYASDPDLNDRFGSGIAVLGRTLFVGAFSDDELSSDAGAVYVFEEVGGTWTETQKLFASDGNSFNFFGTGLAVDSDYLVVGAADADGAVRGSGAAYVFQDNGVSWVEVAKLSPVEGEFDDDIGQVNTIDGDVVVVNAPKDDTADTDSGAFYLFSLSGVLCPILTANPPIVSLSNGGTQKIGLAAGAASGEAFYWLVGSLDGTCPGFPLFGLRMPVNPDDYFSLTLVESGSSPLANNMGVLDPQGGALSQLIVPPNTDPTLVGLKISHAFASYRLGPFQLLEISNPVELLLVQ